MAEQDRPDAVPAVLNDLMDVDGTPAEGDGLAYTTGAWRPGVAAGLLPEFGAALTLYEGLYNGAALADNTATWAAWQGMTIAQYSGYEAYPGVHPVMGSWATKSTNLWTWRADEPGVYNAYIYTRFNLDGASHADSVGSMGASLSAVMSHIWGIDRVLIKVPGQGAYSGVHVDNLTLPISQGMIDAGFGGFDVASPLYFTAGSERINQLTLFVAIERYTPGSTFDYYGEL